MDSVEFSDFTCNCNHSEMVNVCQNCVHNGNKSVSMDLEPGRRLLVITPENQNDEDFQYAKRDKNRVWTNISSFLKSKRAVQGIPKAAEFISKNSDDLGNNSHLKFYIAWNSASSSPHTKAPIQETDIPIGATSYSRTKSSKRQRLLRLCKGCISSSESK